MPVAAAVILKNLIRSAETPLIAAPQGGRDFYGKPLATRMRQASGWLLSN
jgi:hypothetical protein